jgi:hypothetical protein
MIQELRENQSKNMVSGVILSGKRTVHNQFLEYAGVESKALIDIAGKVMIQHSNGSKT